MELKGLTINFLGDSITEGVGTTDASKTFHQLIKEKYDLKEAYNYGVGGTRIARQVVPTITNTIYDFTFELRTEVMNRKADAVVVFGGTNDFGHGDAPFGNVDSEDVYTFCGAVNSLCKKLKRDFPDAKIVFMTPLHRLREKELSYPDSKNLESYVDAIIEICKNNDISVIDLFRINPLDPEDKDVIPDGLHPNDKGHAILADIVAEELLKM